MSDIGTLATQDHIDAVEQLMANSAHDHAAGLDLSVGLLEAGAQLRVMLASAGSDDERREETALDEQAP